MTTPAEYRARYEHGESILDLALDARCSRESMRELLVNAGAVIRPKHGGRGLHRSIHMPATARDGAEFRDPDARIARPSVARWMR